MKRYVASLKGFQAFVRFCAKVQSKRFQTRRLARVVLTRNDIESGRVFTYFLWNVAKSTDETAQISQRAFLSFAGVQAGEKQIDPTGHKWVNQQVMVMWSNSGTTPAKEAIARVSWGPWNGEMPSGFGFPDNTDVPPRPGVVGPKATYGVPLVLGIDSFREVRDGKSHLFLWGWTTYRDIFPKDPKRLTEFCVEITNVTSTKVDMSDPAGDISWQSIECREHNCYDDDCTDYDLRTR